MSVKLTSALRPDVPSFGYAAILSINATSIWGGIFPYLTPALQTPATTVVYYTVQIAAFLALLGGALVATWTRPQLAKSAHALAYSAPLSCGSLLLVGAMYLEGLAGWLIIAAAVLIGAGSSGFVLGWQRVFAAMDPSRGNLALIKGTGFSAVLYFLLGLIPAALTAYLIPLVLVPLAGLCLWLGEKATSTDQPMFEDVPSQHKVVYRNALRDSVRPALSVGALGFCAGAVRFIAVTHQGLLSTINIVSMFMLLAVVAVFYAAWSRRTVRFDLMSVFRMLFPVVATIMVALPFAGPGFADFGFGASYACFMLGCVLMMMHCAQISRSGGINPVFIYAFYAGAAYSLQMLGYLVGYASGSEHMLGVEQLSFVAIVSLYVLLVVALAGRRVAKLRTHRLEFLMLTPEAARASASAEIAVSEGLGAAAGGSDGSAEAGSGAQRAANAAGARASASDGGEPSLKQRCRQLADLYGLTDREREVMELMAQGLSGPAIAAQLFISENTMRTHNKRIYTKLGIHKKQELMALVREAD